MVGVKLAHDCYFFLHSSCNKADLCNFRHEPLAKLTDTVCYYWQTSKCTRHSCPYRHSEVDSSSQSYRHQRSSPTPALSTPSSNLTVEKKVNKQCFWDKQPSGCQKRHCGYIHCSKSSSNHDDTGSSSYVTSCSPGQEISSGSIILNKNKLHTLRNIIPLTSIESHQDGSKPRRVVVPPSTGFLARREITGGIKNRLGKTGVIKDRLGSKGDELFLVSDDSRELSPDVEIIQELRTSALKSIDLRNRLDYKFEKMKESSSPEILQYESDSDQRRSAKSKKFIKAIKEKKKKKVKEKTGKQCNEISVRDGADLPSASDYSDLDTPSGSPDPSEIKLMSQTAGMYADTNAVSQSAKVRLGKRKSEDRHGESSLTVMHKLEAKKRLAIELRCGEKRAYDELPDFSKKPRRDSLDIFVDRNPSPPKNDGSTLISIKRTIINTPSRSPSPPASKRCRSMSPDQLQMQKRKRRSSSMLALIERDESDAKKVKKESECRTKKVKLGKSKKLKRSKKGEKASKKNQEDKKKKKKSKKSKKRRVSCGSSRSPSPLPKSKKYLKADEKSTVSGVTKKISNDAEKKCVADNDADLMKELDDFINQK